jgi:hypothetical protein
VLVQELVDQAIELLRLLGEAQVRGVLDGRELRPMMSQVFSVPGTVNSLGPFIVL